MHGLHGLHGVSVLYENHHFLYRPPHLADRADHAQNIEIHLPRRPSRRGLRGDARLSSKSAVAGEDGRQARRMKLHLQCRTQDEIAKAVGMTQRGVGEVLEEIANLQRVLNPSELDPKLGAYCRSYALEAERKMGQMLKETERADGGDAQRTRLRHVTESPPTLSALGLTKRESAEAQMLAALSEATRTRSLSFDAATGTLRAAKAIVVRRHTPPGSYQSSQCNAVSGYAKERSLRVTHFHEITS